MKLSSVLLLMTMLHVSAAELYSQTAKLSLNMQQVTLSEVFDRIESQSEFLFFYSNVDVDKNMKVDVDASNQRIEEVLNSVLKNTSLVYAIKDRHILLISKKEFMEPAQQGIAITGTVTDVDGEPIPGVNITVKGTITGSVTDVNGKYTVHVPNNEAVLVFSFVGYAAQEITVGDRTMIDITLAEETLAIDEVVVIGYGTARKVNYSGAVVMASAKDLENRPVTNVSSALAGLGSGISVRQSSGKPGDDGATIRMRGTGSLGNQDPLVVIDGIEGNMNAVNPNDIESISFLKDAASGAIYGAKGSNGVILITTKKGAKGAPRISYSGIFSLEQPSNLFEYVSHSATQMKLINEAAYNFGRGANAYFSQATIDTWDAASKDPNGYLKDENGNQLWDVPNWLAYPNTNWAKEVFEKNWMQSHNLSISGATDDVSYSISGNFLDNPGIMQVTGLKRYQLRANIEARIAKILTVGTKTFGSIGKSEMGDTGNAFGFLNQTTPAIVPYYNGMYGYRQLDEEPGEVNNILFHLNSKLGYSQTNRINTTWYAKLELMKGLALEGNYNYQQTDNYQRPKQNPLARYNMRTGNIAIPARAPEDLTTTYYNSKVYSYTVEAILRYATTINKDHSISAFVAVQQRYSNTEELQSVMKGLIDPDLTVFSSATEMQSITGTEVDNATRSYFGRINYDYKSKYLLEANFRYDGTSKADKDYRWGFFPSFSGAWRISEEAFMEGTKGYISNIKLRASWGKLGNVNNVGNYTYQAVYSAVNYPFGGSVSRGLRQSQVANPLLQWENSNMTDIGLDFSLLKNRLNVELDWYDKLTENMLGQNTSQYLTMGTITPATMNLYNMRNKGFEITMGWKDRINDFRYSISGNFSYNKNEITKYQGTLIRGWFDTDGNPANPGDPGATYQSNIGQVSAGVDGNMRRLEGHPFNEYYLHTPYKGNATYFNEDGTVNINGGPKNGMIRTTDDMKWAQAMVDAGYQFHQNIGQTTLWYGDYIYADNNGDGLYGLTNDQQFQEASNVPKYVFGLNFNAAWKGFDFSMQWAGAAGFKYYWYASYINGPSVKNGSAIGLDLANNHYFYNDADPTDPNNNINAKFPRLRLESDISLASTINLYNASYVKLKNLQFGYTLPNSVLSKIHLQNVRVYVSGENLVTITNFPGLDPEIGSSATAYPTMRQYAIGINLTF